MAEGPVTAVDFDYSIRKSWIKSDIYGNNIKSKKIPYCKRIVLARWYQLEFFFYQLLLVKSKDAMKCRSKRRDP